MSRMDRIRKWLIHKLGGFSELPIREPNIVMQKTCDVIPVAYKLRVGKDEYLRFPSYYEEKICKEIMEGLLENKLIYIKQKDDIENCAVEVIAKVYAVKRG